MHFYSSFVYAFDNLDIYLQAKKPGSGRSRLLLLSALAHQHHSGNNEVTILADCVSHLDKLLKACWLVIAVGNHLVAAYQVEQPFLI
jgi:hypothetical protein